MVTNAWGRITLVLLIIIFLMIGLLVFNATFNNISVISWRSVLLVEETGKNHRPVAGQTLSHNVVSITTTKSPIFVRKWYLIEISHIVDDKIVSTDIYSKWNMIFLVYIWQLFNDPQMKHGLLCVFPAFFQRRHWGTGVPRLLSTTKRRWWIKTRNRHRIVLLLSWLV